jgi:protein TonB
LLRETLLGLGSSTAVHGACAASLFLCLLAWPTHWEFEIRRGETVVIQAQLAAVAATQPVEVREVEVSIEPVPLEPPPPVAIDHTPIRDTLEPVPAVIPVVRVGECEPRDVLPPEKSPESPAKVELTIQAPTREVAKRETPQPEVTQELPDRQVADIVRDTPNKISVAAAVAAEAGAQVDEMPRKLSHNREPNYPLEALRAGLEGKVVLRVMISATGRATQISVESSSGFSGFDESATLAVRDWEFAPAKRQGVAVHHEVLVPVRFRIRRS